MLLTLMYKLPCNYQQEKTEFQKYAIIFLKESINTKYSIYVKINQE